MQTNISLHTIGDPTNVHSHEPSVTPHLNIGKSIYILLSSYKIGRIVWNDDL